MNKRSFLKCLGVAMAAPSILAAEIRVPCIYDGKQIWSSFDPTPVNPDHTHGLCITGGYDSEIKTSEINGWLAKSPKSTLIIDEIRVIIDESIYKEERVSFTCLCNFTNSSKNKRFAPGIQNGQRYLNKVLLKKMEDYIF